MIRLAVNADDFGFTRDVNDGIAAAHRDGILTSATLMATGPAFDHAILLSQASPRLDIGCHLVLIGGESLTCGPLPANLTALVGALARGRIPVYDEFAAQVRKIQAAGIQPTHLDTHKHTHLVPSVLQAIARISRDFGIPWIRRPFDLSPAGFAGWAMLARRSAFDRVLAGSRSTDHFVGFALTGRLDASAMVEALSRLPEGFTEFMCHPGFCRDELRHAPTRLKESRERELEALVSPAVRRVVEERGILLTPFSYTPK